MRWISEKNWKRFWGGGGGGVERKIGRERQRHRGRGKGRWGFVCERHENYEIKS